MRGNPAVTPAPELLMLSCLVPSAATVTLPPPVSSPTIKSMSSRATSGGPEPSSAKLHVLSMNVRL